MAWSGLFDGVHGDGHTLINGDPRGEWIQDLMQKRGLYGYAKAYGGTVPATRRQGDYSDGGGSQNRMFIPGSADDGRNPPNRDYLVDNAHGDVRPLQDANTVPQVSPEAASYAVDTRIRFTYAEDLSGNGGVGKVGSP